MIPADFRFLSAPGREQLRAALAHAAMRREHTAKCVAVREDPGAACVCRPPACAEPKQPTPHEAELAARGAR